MLVGLTFNTIIMMAEAFIHLLIIFSFITIFINNTMQNFAKYIRNAK